MSVHNKTKISFNKIWNKNGTIYNAAYNLHGKKIVYIL